MKKRLRNLRLIKIRNNLIYKLYSEDELGIDEISSIFRLRQSNIYPIIKVEAQNKKTNL